MLERFRHRYPSGSLTSELLTIDRGKYLVRASVQVDGTLLGTGMAEGDTIEQAEDRARLRAIAVLAIDAEAAVVSQPETSLAEEPPKPSPIELPEPAAAASQPETSLPEKPPKPSPTELPAPEPAAAKRKAAPPPEAPKPRDLELPAPTPVTEPVVETAIVENVPPAIAEPAPAEIPPKSAAASKKRAEPPAAEIPPPVAEPLTLTPPETDPGLQFAEPIDFSEVIAKSDMELKRLSWTSEQGRNYLLGTYGKRSRQLLSDEELIEFLQYLQSLPNP